MVKVHYISHDTLSFDILLNQHTFARLQWKEQQVTRLVNDIQQFIDLYENGIVDLHNYPGARRLRVIILGDDAVQVQASKNFLYKDYID